MSNQYLSFDVTKQSAPQQLITGRQGDSQLKFVTMLFWDGDKNIPYDLTGKQVAFEALKPDNTHIVDYEGITILDAPAGLVRYSFNEQMFSVSGTMQQAFFKITHTDSDNNVITDSTLEVAINILENRVEFGINSKDYLSEYNKLVAEVKKKFDDYAATVQDSIDKAQALHDQIIEYTNLINSGAVILKKDFGDIKDLKMLGNTVIDKINNEFEQRSVNVSWFTNGSDSVENNTQAFIDAIAYASNKGLPIMIDRDYNLSNIVVDKSVVIYGNYHTLSSNGNGESFISVVKTENNKTEVTIHELSIINKGSYDTGISNIDSVLNLYNFSIYNFNKRNIFIKKLTTDGYGIFQNITCESCPIGIDLNTTDISIDNYMGHNCYTHINGVGGNDILNNIHGWNWNYQDKNWVDGSNLITLVGSARLTNIYADSLETAIKLEGTYKKYALISILNINYFLNKDVLPNNEPHLINNIDDFTGKLNITGISADSNGWGWGSNPIQKNPQLITGNIDSRRMTITGLMSNGFEDVHNINRKYNQTSDFYKLSDDNKLSIYDHFMEIQSGIGEVYIGSSLTKKIEPGERIAILTFTDPIFNNLTTFNINGSAKNSDGSIQSLGVWFNKKNNEVSIYNTSTVNYDAVISFQMGFSCLNY